MKTTTAEQDPQAAVKLRELIEDIAVAMVVTVTPDGALRSRPMLTQTSREEGELWFFTSDESGAAHDIAEEHGVNICYADPGQDRYVSVTGQASIIGDEKLLKQLWEPALTRFFPKGLADPRLALLRVRIESAEYWDGSTSRMVPLRIAAKAGNSPDKRSAERASSNIDEEGEHTKVGIRSAPASG